MGSFVILLIDLTVISRDLLPAGIHFLVVLLDIKLLTLNSGVIIDISTRLVLWQSWLPRH